MHATSDDVEAGSSSLCFCAEYLADLVGYELVDHAIGSALTNKTLSFHDVGDFYPSNLLSNKRGAQNVTLPTLTDQIDMCAAQPLAGPFAWLHACINACIHAVAPYMVCSMTSCWQARWPVLHRACPFWENPALPLLWHTAGGRCCTRKTGFAKDCMQYGASQVAGQRCVV